MMAQWEYRKFEIQVVGNEYIAQYENNTSMQGWDSIMEYWDSYGWELVSLAPLEYTHSSGWSTDYRIARFLAVWKRRKAVQEQ